MPAARGGGRPRTKPLAVFGQRLRQAIDASEKYENRNDFIKKLNLDANTVARYENGERKIPDDFLRLCARELGVSTDRLLGEDLRESHVETRLIRDEPEMTKATREMLAGYLGGRGAKLPEEVKTTLIKVVGRVGDPKDERDLDDMARVIERGFELRAQEPPPEDD